MRDFVNNVLAELQNNQNVKNNGLIQMVVESANKSIVNNESYESIYNQIKIGLSAINEQVSIPEVSTILSQFNKIEDTNESKLANFAKIGNLSSKLNSIKESKAYSHPIIADKVNRYMSDLKSGSAEFMLYPAFINDFKSHMIEESVKNAVNSISRILESNASKFEVMHSITLMENMNSPLYKNVCEDLKEMLVNESYTADVIDFKYGSTGLPMITALVNSLKIVESKATGSFTLGAGNSDTKVRNMICPAIKSAKKSILTYMDNRFIRLTESDKLNGSELEVNAKGNGFSISTIDPTWVKNTHPRFYEVCEAYARLGFRPSENRAGVETSNISKFNIGLTVNERKELDLYINDKKIGDAREVNISESLVMTDDLTKNYVKTILENTSMILNLEFIKNVINDRTLAESVVFNLGQSYFVCDKLNGAEREWSRSNEHAMYEHFMSKFNYDISPIFGTKIDESIQRNKVVEARKAEIKNNISKLETSVSKLVEASNSRDINPADIAKLDSLKESINKSILALKDEYIKLDIFNSKLNESEESEKDSYCMKKFGKKYSECSDDQKSMCDKHMASMKKNVSEQSEGDLMLSDEESNTWGNTAISDLMQTQEKRDEYCMNAFGKTYAECSPEEQEECDMTIGEMGMTGDMGMDDYGYGLGEAAKPDFLDLDGDGDKKEPMKKAAKDKKKSKVAKK